jgi:hypothetical protein
MASRIGSMPNLQEITAAIDGRLDEVRNQIASLEAARSALTTTPASPARRRTARPRRAEPTTPTRPTRARKSSSDTAAPASKPKAPAAAVESESGRAHRTAPVTASTTPSPTPTRQRRAAKRAARGDGETAPVRRPSRRRPQELAAGQLEKLLRESENGLSVVALARQTGVGEAKVRERLDALQRAGEARSSGSRRTSLWRLLSDEERIAERAAELARASNG